MKYRKLGKYGPIVSAVGLGCMGMSEYYGSITGATSRSIIQEAYKSGVTFFDTADMYGEGENERILGNAIKDFREKVIVATKCGIQVSKEGLQINNTRDYIKSACDGSLERLNTNYIDIYYLHRHNPNTPIEEAMLAMQDLINMGKIRYVGLSEVDSETIERAHQVLNSKLIAVQTEYSLVNRSVAEEVLPTCRKLDIAFVPYSPIARGFLSGKITAPTSLAGGESDFRSCLPQFQTSTLPFNLRLVTAVETLAKKKGCTTAQLSLAWLLAQGEDVVPIPGTRKQEYLMENVASVDITLLPEDLTSLNNILKENPIQGERLPEGLMKAFYLKK